MERTIISPEFKGGIWHRFFSPGTKKDETLLSILDEKIRYYKLYYPFLEKKQIMGKAYEELGIPHICGDLNRKELYKMFLKERKNQCKLKEKYKKYPSLFIENKSKNKATIKKPTVPTTKPIKVNNVHTNVQKSKEDLVFDNLLSNINPKRKEGLIHSMNLKQTKSVRFKDGIEVHSVSPSQPLYKLKPLGRLFDEPSAVRVVDTPSPSQQELQERIEDSDSDFDADTGITSDVEDYDLEDSTEIKNFRKNTEITENGKVEENSLLNTKTKAIYDCSEDDSQSMDHEIRKEGNDLILSSKMIMFVQGKWVRETKRIIGNTDHNKDIIMSNTTSVQEDANDGQELDLMRNIEHILENIKSLYISATEEHQTSSDTISSINRNEIEQNIEIKKEQLMVANIEVGQDLTDIEIAMGNKNEPKQRTKFCSKNINSKISLEKDLSTHLMDEKLFTIDNNKLSYDHDIRGLESNMEENIEKRVRTKPIKLIDDLIDYINDWNSSNEGSLNYNPCLTLPTKPMDTNDPEKDKYMKAKEVMKVKNMLDDEGTSEYSIEKENRLYKEEDKLEDLPLIEQSCLDKEENNLGDLSCEEKSSLKEHSPLLSVNNNQQVNSHCFESNASLNIRSPSTEIIIPEPLSLSDKLRSTNVREMQYETDDSISNFSMPFSKINEVFEEKELQINDTFTFVRGIVFNQSTSNPNELHSTFCSLITKPILVQSQYVEEEGGDQDNYKKLESSEREELDQGNKKMQSGYSVSEHELNSGYRVDNKTQGMTKDVKEIKDEEQVNMRLSEEYSENHLKENVKIIVGSKSLNNSVFSMISMDHTNSPLTDQYKDKDRVDNTSKIFTTEKKLFDESENIPNDIQTTEMYEDHIVESETNSTNFLSKVQMWSLHSKRCSGNSTMASQTSSMLASCNTDSLQKKVVDMEGSINTTVDHCNESCNNNLASEDSFTSRSNEENNILEELNNSSMDLEAESSTTTVTPVKVEKKDSEEVSTAYETDPETGKLVMNRSLRPITSSTPIKLEQIHEPQDFSPERRPNENSFEDLSNQSLEQETKNKQSFSISVIDESSIKSDRKSRNENDSSELSSHVSLLTTYDKRNETETNDILNKNGKQEETNKIDLKNNKNRDLNDLTETSTEKHNEILSETDKPAFQDDDNNKSSSESIIENSETDRCRTFKKEKNSNIVRTIMSHTISTGKQEGEFTIERYQAKAEVDPMETSIKLNIENCNTFTISETLGSCNDQQTNSKEATYGSTIQPNELNASKKKVTSADSPNTDIMYYTSSITQDLKFGQYTKTSTVRLPNTMEGEYNISESKNLINGNELYISDKLVLKDNKNRPSATSDSKINNHSKIDVKFKSGSCEKLQRNNKIFNPNQLGAVLSHSSLEDENLCLNSPYNDLKNEGEKTDLGSRMPETCSKKIAKDRQTNVSHVTYLIRDPTPPEDTESGYQQLVDLSQLDNTTKMKQHEQNKKSTTNEIISTPTKINTVKETNGSNENKTLKLPNSNLQAIDNNCSNFSIGVQNCHIEPSLLSNSVDKHKYFTQSRTLSLKRKLGKMNEDDNGSDLSLSQDELSRKETKMNVSSGIHSTVAGYSESPFTTDSSSIEMNLKRVNTDIRKKRAKLKKENPVKKSSTSSSEDEIKKPLLKGKSFESSKSVAHKFTESHQFDHEDNIDSVGVRTQQNFRKSYNNQKDSMPRDFSTLSLSLENETTNESFNNKSLKRQKETEYNYLSDSSTSIIYSSPNAKTGLQEKITKTYDKLKMRFDKNIKKRHLEEESQYFSGNFNSAKKRSEKSHKSYPIYRKYDVSNKENHNIPHKDSRSCAGDSKKILGQSTPGKSDTVLEAQKDQNNEMKNPPHAIKKNRKSSIVRLIGSAEAGQISHSPEVKGLLRRTYFMGNH